MSQASNSKKVILATAALIAGVVGMPIVAFVNTVVGLIVLSLPVAFIYMAS